jgi:hypothetical protein
MNIRALGLDYSLGSLGSSERFNSPISLFEFDVVIIDWITLFKYISNQAREVARGGSYFEYKDWTLISSLIQKRNSSIQEFLDHDRILLVFVSPLTCKYDFVNEHGNFEKTKLDSLCPRPLISAQAVEGSKVSIADAAPKEFREFLTGVKDIIEYHGSFPLESGIPLLTIEGTKKVVASWCPTKNGGGTIFFPYPTNNSTAYVITFLEALDKLCTQLKNSVHKELPPLPDWHVKYQLLDEVQQHIEIDRIKEEQAKLFGALSDAESKLENVLFLKRLFTDQGNSLLEAAAKSFQYLGYSVKYGPEGRDDLILEGQGGSKFVIEVKGRDNKSAAEADCAQLEKWVARFYEEHNVEPKGVLVINGYRTQPLDKRTEPVFPNQMLAYAKRKEHCLLTGYQLLSLVLAVQQGKISQVDAQKSISNAVGICQQFSTIDDCIALLAKTRTE